MATLNDALIELVDKGLVEGREAYTKAVDKTGFAAMLTQRGLAGEFIESADTKPVPPVAGKPVGPAPRR